MADTEMADAVEAAALASPFRPSVTFATNGTVVASTVISAPMSREQSVQLKIKEQLALDSDSDDDDDDWEGLQQRKEAVDLPPLPYTSLSTGLCYDSRMRFHTELNPPHQRSDFHPEDPRRILAIYQTLCLSGLVDDPAFRPRISLVQRPLKRIAARHASKEEVLMVHSDSHFNFLQDTTSGLLSLPLHFFAVT